MSWKRGAHCAPEAGRHQRIQVRAHSGAKQTQFCLLLLSCVTLGTWLYLSGPYTHSSVGWTHSSVGWKPGHPCQSENSGTKLRLRDQGPTATSMGLQLPTGAQPREWPSGGRRPSTHWAPIQLPPEAGVRLPIQGYKTPTGSLQWGLWLPGINCLLRLWRAGQKSRRLGETLRRERGALTSGAQA